MARMFCKFDQVTKSYLPYFTQRLSCVFNPFNNVVSPLCLMNNLALGCLAGQARVIVYNHWKQLVRRSRNFVRDEIILSKATSRVIEGLQSLFYRRVIARVSHIRGTWLYFWGNKRGYPRGARVRSVLVSSYFILWLGHLAIDFWILPYTPSYYTVYGKQ